MTDRRLSGKLEKYHCEISDLFSRNSGRQGHISISGEIWEPSTIDCRAVVLQRAGAAIPFGYAFGILKLNTDSIRSAPSQDYLREKSLFSFCDCWFASIFQLSPKLFFFLALTDNYIIVEIRLRPSLSYRMLYKTVFFHCVPCPGSLYFTSSILFHLK